MSPAMNKGALFFCALIAVSAHAMDGQKNDTKGIWNGDIRRFEMSDFDLWRSGKWLRDRHEGRLGWWWVVGDLWYFYPQPVYPYPDPYIPPNVLVRTDKAERFWYYCEFSKAYYPYVQICPEKWKVVPAVPVQ